MWHFQRWGMATLFPCNPFPGRFQSWSVFQDRCIWRSSSRCWWENTRESGILPNKQLINNYLTRILPGAWVNCANFVVNEYTRKYNDQSSVHVGCTDVYRFTFVFTLQCKSMYSLPFFRGQCRREWFYGRNWCLWRWSGKSICNFGFIHWIQPWTSNSPEPVSGFYFSPFHLATAKNIKKGILADFANLKADFAEKIHKNIISAYLPVFLLNLRELNFMSPLHEIIISHECTNLAKLKLQIKLIINII